ncbi:MAG: U32 family peptidase, partial [Candidatus Omnitrophica bacterium]|nr:U32 family peptidase [Candidatus Omnitrophota bacterium]
DLIDGLKGYPVLELYGKLRQDAIGGGRAPYQLAAISRKRLAAHVAHVHRAGFEFNYLLNSSCLGNKDITRKGQKEIEELLNWINSIKVNSVTVASPFLLKMVKRRYPHIKVRISVFAAVDRVIKARMWEDLGADCIVLDSLLVNRELKVLENIRKHIKTDLELMVNNSCLMGCALSPSHMNSIAHTAQASHANKGFFMDWAFMKCTQMKLQEPVNYIRSEWIRPEDLHIYEALGYDRFKLVERDIPTAFMLKRVKAYVDRRYEGNLLDLVQPYGFKGIKVDKRHYNRGLYWSLRFIFRPDLVNPFRMTLLKKLADIRNMTSPVEGEEPVVIDNRALDGFMERFKKKGCRDEDCAACRWCHRFADKAVKINVEKRQQALMAYEKVFDSMEKGDMWRFLPEKACVSESACSGCGH